MKKHTSYIIHHTFAIVIIMIAMTSCDNFLTVEPTSQIGADNYYQSPAEADRALSGVYGTLKPFAKYWFAMSELRSDNMFETKEAKQYDYADCAQFNATGLLSDNIVANCWADHYTLIAAANALIDKLPEIDFSTSKITKEQYIAEARFLRALSYFDLVRFYGRVPVSLHQLSADEAFHLAQSEPLEVYQQAIIPDLEYAALHLGEYALDYNGNTHSERASQAAAKALLGKVYMQMAGFPLNQPTKDKAKTYLKEVLDYAESSNRYWSADMDEWNRMWIHENDNKYYIFEIQYVCAANQGNPVTPLSRTSNSKPDAYCNAYLTNGNHFYIERALQSRMMADQDLRCHWTLDMGYKQDEETGETTGGYNPDVDHFLVKFFEHKTKRDSLGFSNMDATIVNYTYWPQNFPVLRIEDIALLYAECVGGNEGLAIINRTRQRAGLAPLAAYSEEALIEERRAELLGEGHRWFDEVRHNTYVQDNKTKFEYYRDNCDKAHSSVYTMYAARVNSTSMYYPIPLSQMQVCEGLYQQNPGY